MSCAEPFIEGGSNNPPAAESTSAVDPEPGLVDGIALTNGDILNNVRDHDEEQQQEQEKNGTEEKNSSGLSEPVAKKAKVNDSSILPPPDFGLGLGDIIINPPNLDFQLENQTTLSTTVEPPSTCHSVVGTEDSKTTASNSVNLNEPSNKAGGLKDDDDMPVYLGRVYDQQRSREPGAILPDDAGNGENSEDDDDGSDIEIVYEQQNMELSKPSGAGVDRSKIRVNLTHFQQAKKKLVEVMENYRRLEAVGMDSLLVLLPTCLPMLLSVVRQVTPVDRMERLLSLQAVQPFGEEEQKCILDYLYENFHEFSEGNQSFSSYMEMILMPELTVRLYALVNHISVEQAETEMFKALGVINYAPWMEDTSRGDPLAESSTSASDSQTTILLSDTEVTTVREVTADPETVPEATNA